MALDSPAQALRALREVSPLPSPPLRPVSRVHEHRVFCSSSASPGSPASRRPIAFFISCILSLVVALYCSRNGSSSSNYASSSARYPNTTGSTGIFDQTLTSTLNSTLLVHGEDISIQSKNSTSSMNDPLANAIFAEQIANYKAGKALMISIHITHHAGTYFCAEMKRWGSVPNFACMGGNNWNKTLLPSHRPWTYTETAVYAPLIRTQFHMWSWEFGKVPRPPLDGVNWEHPAVISVYISRHPMDRLLSGSGGTNKLFGKSDERTREQWWAYSNHSNTDNFALHRLTGGTCVKGEDTPTSCLDVGKKLLSRITIILDQNCLDEGMVVLANLLGGPLPLENGRMKNKPKSVTKGEYRERIGHDDICDYLERKNRMDIALYEWSKPRSLVSCD